MTSEAAVRELAARKGLTAEQVDRLLAGESVQSVTAPPFEWVQGVEPAPTGLPPDLYRDPWEEQNNRTIRAMRDQIIALERELKRARAGEPEPPKRLRMQLTAEESPEPEVPDRFSYASGNVVDSTEQTFEVADRPDPAPKIALRGSQGPRKRSCESCGTNFVPQQKSQIYCTPRCRTRAWRSR